MSTKYEEFINQVKKTIQDQPIPPKYNPKKWKGKSFNCYVYAMRACMNFKSSDEFLVKPGIISRGAKNDYKDTKECTLNYFKEDCEALGLQIVPSNLKEKTRRNEYKIAVYVKPGYDFHFARQDSNGRWSEKNGWNKPIEILKKKDVTKNEDGYEFIGIFKLSKKTG